MKRLSLSLCLLFAFATLAPANLISEFQPNPVGTDPATVSVELSGTAFAFFDVWLLSIETDVGSPIGLVDRAENVTGTYDANGLAVVSIGDLENPSFTFVLLENFTGTVGLTDIDVDNDGTADDLSTFVNVFDAIGIPDIAGDEAFQFGAQLGGQDFVYSGDEPKLVFRAGSVGAWYAVNDQGFVPENVFDVFGTQVANNLFSADPEATTFGALNPTVIPEPSTFLLALVGCLTLHLRRRNK